MIGFDVSTIVVQPGQQTGAGLGGRQQCPPA